MHTRIRHYLEKVCKRPSMYFRFDDPRDLESQLHGMAVALDLPPEETPNYIISQELRDLYGVSTNSGWGQAIRDLNPGEKDLSAAVLSLISHTFGLPDSVDATEN